MAWILLQTLQKSEFDVRNQTLRLSDSSFEVLNSKFRWTFRSPFKPPSEGELKGGLKGHSLKGVLRAA